MKLYLAGYRGIKAGNPAAMVAAGETSNRGLNHPVRGVSGSTAPATFARLVAAADPHLPFAAWATHPYPTVPWLGPAQKVAYPNVALTTLPRSRRDYDVVPPARADLGQRVGGRDEAAGAHGVTYAQQARDATAALKLAASNPDVDMFVWLVLRDSGPSQWSSGLETRTGKRKPAYAAFARTVDAIPSVLRPAR